MTLKINLLWNVYIFYIAGKCITRSNLTIVQTGKIEIDTQWGEFQEWGFNKRDHRPVSLYNITAVSWNACVLLKPCSALRKIFFEYAVQF